MSILNSIAMDSALHASNSLAGSGHISRDMGSSALGPDAQGTLEDAFVPCGYRSEIVTLGSWPREADGAPEPLQWRVVGERADGTKLLVALDIIERRNAHDFDGDVNWQQSSLRYWLHKVFLSHAFTPEERTHIPTVQLITFDNDEFSTIGCFGTEDRVFCLSSEEALHFFPTDTARVARRTGYVKRLPSLPCWWLRSPGGHQFAFQTVAEEGTLDSNGFHATLDCVGIRPAVLMNETVTSKNMPHHQTISWKGSAAGKAGGVPRDGSTDGQPATTPAKGAKRTVATTRDPFGPGDSAFCGHRSTANPGYAIAYADEPLARRELARTNLLKAQPDLAIAGGYPSVLLINRLLGDGVLDVKNQFRLCQSAIPAHEDTLVRRMVKSGSFGEYRLGQLLSTCVAAGSLDLALFLVKMGAKGDGYAQAYVPSATLEDAAACAVAVDPVGALALWEHVRRHPAAIRQLVAAFMRGEDAQTSPDHMEQLFGLPDLLAACAEQGFIREVRFLASSNDYRPTSEQFVQAIQAAKHHDHTELCAYLIDRQAAYYSTSLGDFGAPASESGEPSSSEPAPRTSSRPVLEL